MSKAVRAVPTDKTGSNGNSENEQLQSAMWRTMMRRVVIAGLLFGFVILCLTSPTLLGFTRIKYAKWEEEQFVGKPVSELRQHLANNKRKLRTVDADSLYHHTGKQLKSGKFLFRFSKGESFTWFYIGNVSPLGLVIVEGDAEKGKIVEIIRSGEIDSL